MGEFLTIGICSRIFIDKNSRQVNKINPDDLTKILSNNVEIKNYDFYESDKFFVWKLKDEFFTGNNITKLMKEFFKDYYLDSSRHDTLNIIYEKLEKLGSSKEILDFASKKSYQEFQISQYREYIDFGIGFNIGEYFYFDNIIFTLDGKIMMECYNNLLKYMELLVREKYKKHELAGSFKVMIG